MSARTPEPAAVDGADPVEPDGAASQAEPVTGGDASEDAATAAVAALTAQLDEVAAERDDYLDQLQRQRAEFQNFRRRIESDRQQQIAAGVGRLVESLLPVLDGCDAAVTQGHTEVEAVRQALMVALGKAGLERIDAVGEAFDPTQHEAVTIEQAPVSDAGSGDGEGAEPSSGEPDAFDDNGSGDGAVSRQVVTAELRSGFRFDGRVLRAAMVKVRTA